MDPSPPNSRPAAAPQDRRSLDQTLELVESLQAQLDQWQAKDAWAQRLETLGTLAAQLAHETNNLLTPLRSYAQLALGKPDDPQAVRKALETAIRTTDQIQRLSDATLGYAQPCSPLTDEDAAAGLDAPVATCAFADAWDAAVACLSPIIDRVGVQIEAKAEPAELRLAIDPLAMQQVFVNLLTNAIDAMQRRGGPTRLRVEAIEQHRSAVITVHDSGPGIDASLGQRVFEPYVSGVDSSPPTSDSNACSTSDLSPGEDRRSVRRGSGLGLSVCKRLIDTAGGRINLCASTLGGAGFEIELPLAD